MNYNKKINIKIYICIQLIFIISVLSFQLQLTISQMYLTKEGKPTHQRNVTPNFQRFNTKKSISKAKLQQGLTQTVCGTQRSSSKASRTSFDVYQKRVLHLSKLKNTITIKQKQATSAIKKRREGLQVTGRNNSNKKSDFSQEKGPKKGLMLSSNKNLKQKQPLSRDKNQKKSITKRNEQSLQKEDEKAKLYNKQLISQLIQQQFAPNYVNKLKAKKTEQKEKEKITKSTTFRKKFMNVDFQIKNQQELKSYQIYEELGKGAYGVVKMGINKKTNQKVAIKIYEKKRLDEPNKLKNLEREVNILAKLSHPVIARLIDVIEGSHQIYLIQEYGGANSLYNYLLSKPQHRMQQSQAKIFFKTIAQTLKYLHERNIIHRDIKAQNILLNRNKQLKLIDFGFSLQSIPPNTIDTFCGTPTYMAPEIVSKRDHVPIYTDFWSLGIFYFVILQGNYPFRAKNENELFEKIRKGQFEYIHKDISQKSRHVIQRLIRVNPLERMNTNQLDEAFWSWFMSDTISKPNHSEIITTNMTTNVF